MAKAVVAAVLTGACGGAQAPRPKGGSPPRAVATSTQPAAVSPGATFTIAAAGDVAGAGNAQRATASLLRELLRRDGLKAILVLGDLQYPSGEYRDFLRWYAPSWGAPDLLAITRPVPGNHEYDQGASEAEGYFDYFLGPGNDRGVAGERGRGYYSFDIGDWHFVALNSNHRCRNVPCGRGSEMHRWLVADLAATGKKCVLAYWHAPRFLQGSVHGDATYVAALWDALYDAGADVVLSGHEHNFQQLPPLDKRGNVDRARGIRSFVVGTGGAAPYAGPPRDGQRRPVELRQVRTFGVLELSLGPEDYAWRFVSVRPQGKPAVTARGQDRCH